jgi:hypothetical protein
MPKLILLLPLLALACTNRTVDRPLDADRLLHMAGEEAGQITAPRDRLARQLNIANRETESGRPGAARQTLRAARDTLEHADRPALTDHDRLAGWISLSELARSADDNPFANAALDQALAHLNQLTPHQARCEYVLGVERELRILRGDAPAARLLATAADWAVEIPDQSTRRQALIAFAEESARCRDYDAARTILRHDHDAAWRADALTALADRARWETPGSTLALAKVGSSRILAAPADSPAAEAATATPTSRPFGTALDFRSNYYRRQ